MDTMRRDMELVQNFLWVLSIGCSRKTQTNLLARPMPALVGENSTTENSPTVKHLKQIPSLSLRSIL